MTTAITLEVRKVRRSFCICAGTSVLRRFKAEAQAVAELKLNRSLYEYWAGSASVSVDNAPKVTIYA